MYPIELFSSIVVVLDKGLFNFVAGIGLNWCLKKGADIFYFVKGVGLRWRYRFYFFLVNELPFSCEMAQFLFSEFSFPFGKS